jgi:hypothetical protein
MTSINKFSERINQLIELGDKTLTTRSSVSGEFSIATVNSELFHEFRTSSLSFILLVYNETHPFYNDFNKTVTRATPSDTQKGRGILKSIKSEIDGDWFLTLKGLVSSEIFYDFLEMAEHLIKEGYKDPATVMIGSVLEEHLRQLCIKNSISITDTKNGKLIPKKADLLNSELSNLGIYNKLD